MVKGKPNWSILKLSNTKQIKSWSLPLWPQLTHDPMPPCAPLHAGLFQNVSTSASVCCLFCRFLSHCSERLRLLVMEVNLIWLRISYLSCSHCAPLTTFLAQTFTPSFFLALCPDSSILSLVYYCYLLWWLLFVVVNSSCLSERFTSVHFPSCGS